MIRACALFGKFFFFRMENNIIGQTNGVCLLCGSCLEETVKVVERKIRLKKGRGNASVSRVTCFIDALRFRHH